MLAMLPIKDWIYGAVIVALLAAFGWYTVHERGIGEKKIEAADARAVAAQVVHNGEVENAVKQKLADALKDYELAPVVPTAARIPSVVCYAPSDRAVPHRPGTVAGSDGAGAAVPSGAAKDNAGFDPAPALSADALAADAEILRLKAKVALLQETVQAYQSAGLVAKR
jgi:hypothetical protein